LVADPPPLPSGPSVIVQLPELFVVQLFGVPPMLQVPLIVVFVGPPETVTIADQVEPWLVEDPVKVRPALDAVTVTDWDVDPVAPSSSVTVRLTV
jgi:hypothetical protein